MNILSESINNILAKWDPIGVGKEIASTEYKIYIPTIIRHATNKQNLMNYLVTILVNDMGLFYDGNDENQCEEIQLVCNQIMEINKKWMSSNK